MRKQKVHSDMYSLELDADCVLHVGGKLTFTTVSNVLNQAQALLKTATKFEINLANVTHSDSAALVLLVHWMRDAKTRNKEIVFRHIPDQILAIASLSGLDGLLVS